LSCIDSRPFLIAFQFLNPILLFTSKSQTAPRPSHGPREKVPRSCLPSLPV
jgi:hypothetical protein